MNGIKPGTLMLVGLLLFALLFAGACEESPCSCSDPEPEPPSQIIGSWECCFAEMNDTPRPEMIGVQLTFLEDGTMTSPILTGTDETFTWGIVGDKLVLDGGEYVMMVEYTVGPDTLTWFAEMPMTGRIDYRFTRFVEP